MNIGSWIKAGVNWATGQVKKGNVKVTLPNFPGNKPSPWSTPGGWGSVPAPWEGGPAYIPPSSSTFPAPAVTYGAPAVGIGGEAPDNTLLYLAVAAVVAVLILNK